MNQPHDEYRELQEKLDQAARLCRAEHTGWNTLLDRLAEQEPAKDTADPRRGNPRRKPSSWRIMAMAAAVLIAIVWGFSLLFGPHDSVQAQTQPIEVRRRGIQVTIFSKSENTGPTLFMPLVAPAEQHGLNQPGPTQQHAANNLRIAFSNALPRPLMQQSPGMALVKDQRMVLHLRKGDNEVKFTDVAASIDPTSVRLVSDTDPLGTKVVEQNFEFDLASADALLKRSLERKITCVGKHGKELFEGYLLSFDAQDIVLADKKPSGDPNAPRPKTESISRNKLQAIRIEEMPDDLYTRPTLVWKLRTKRPGNHLTTLTYLCGNTVWRADYVAVITDATPDRDTLDLKAWVTIDNRSGTTYQDAGLKLIAGDVNRVLDPWAPRMIERYNYSYERQLVTENRSGHKLGRKEFTQKSFFEYKLYTLNQPSTIKDRQIKQLGLFKATGIKALRRFVCRSGQGANLHADVQLLVKNEKENQLGRPLPKGMVTLTALDADGDSQLLGRQQIDHTAKDEVLEINMGQAFDVVYGYRVVETSRPAPNHMIETYEFRVRNHKAAAVHVRAVGTLHGYSNWKVTKTTDEFVKHDFKTLHFDFRLQADSEKTITYTVDYRW